MNINTFCLSLAINYPREMRTLKDNEGYTLDLVQPVVTFELIITTIN